MTIRITGMNSGLDTEAIIQELASARSVKVENIKKDQTKLSWKIDAWKALNTKIYSFYSDVLSDMRFDYAYTKKTTKVSDPNAVSVVTSGNAVDGVQSLKVKKIATTAYLTGAEVKVGGKKASGNTTLSELGLTKGMKFKLKVGDKEQEITLGTGDTLSDVAKKFSDAGLNAKFDEGTGRFFISAKESGAAGNFTMASTVLGLPDELQTISKFTQVTDDGTTELTLKAVPKAWDNLSPEEQNGKVENDYNDARDKILRDNRAIIIANKDAIEANYNSINSLSAEEKARTGLQAVTAPGWTDSEISDDQVAEITGKILANNAIIAEEAAAKQYDTIMGSLGLKTKDYDSSDPNWTADGLGTMVKGQDAEIELNGAVFTSSKNTFEINGLTITALRQTKADETITLTTQRDTDGISSAFAGY